MHILEREGLIKTRKNPQDGRSKLVYITDSGRMFRNEVIGALAPDVVRIVAAFPTDLMARLLPDLETFRKFLEADRDVPKVG